MLPNEAVKEERREADDEDNTNGEYVGADKVRNHAFPTGSVKKAARMNVLPTETIRKVMRSKKDGPNLNSEERRTNGDDDDILPGSRKGAPKWNSQRGEGGRR